MGAYLVGLLIEAGAGAHDDKRAARSGAGHRRDVKALLPLFHDPLLGQELVEAQFIYLARCT